MASLLFRLFKLSLYGFVSWLCLAALWAGLPSPSRSSSQSGRYETETLRSGRPLLRVYETSTFFGYNDAIVYMAGESRHGAAVTFRLAQKRNTTLLTLGDGLGIDLSPAFVTEYPYTGQERYTVVNTGDQDGINLPWFSMPDSVLLFWWIHHDTAKITIKVKWVEVNIVEIWSAAGGLQNENPLLRLVFGKSEAGAGNQLKLLEEAVLPYGSGSPSWTYALRVCILAIMAPTALVVMVVFGALGKVLSALAVILWYVIEVLGLYCALVLFIWVVRGRRPLDQDEFISRFPGMEIVGGQGVSKRSRRSRRAVWGASGPIEIDNDLGQDRRPVRNVADFFRSSSPLDDLLATFEATRHLTEPLGGGEHTARSDSMQRSVSRSQWAPSREGVGRHRKRASEESLGESGLIDLEKALPEKPKVVFSK